MNTRLNIGNILGKASKLERVLNRVDDPEYSYTREMGRVVSMDSKDIAHVGNTQDRIETMHRAVRVDNGQSQTLVLFNREVVMPLNIGDELWAVGKREPAGRFRAMAVVVPSLQMYADLTTESGFLGSIKLHVLISVIIGLVGYVLSAQVGSWHHLSQYLLGLVLMALSFLLLTTGLCMKLVCGISEVRGSRVSASDWFMIEKVFGRIDQLVA